MTWCITLSLVHMNVAHYCVLCMTVRFKLCSVKKYGCIASKNHNQFECTRGRADLGKLGNGR